MKTTITFATLIISGLFLSISVYCQDLSSKVYAMNLVSARTESSNISLNESTVSPVIQKDDVVINMEMIESYRRYYNKIQPFSIVDYFKGNGSEISVKYMAYMRVRYNNASETAENFQKALDTEIEKINSEMKNNKTFNASVAYSEEKITEQPKELAKDEKSEGSKEQTISSGKDKSKIVKWTKIKS